MVERKNSVTGTLKIKKDNTEQNIFINGVLNSVNQISNNIPGSYTIELGITLDNWKILNNDTTELDDRVKNYCSNFCVFAKNGCPKECPLLGNKIP